MGRYVLYIRNMLTLQFGPLNSEDKKVPHSSFFAISEDSGWGVGKWGLLLILQGDQDKVGI